MSPSINFISEFDSSIASFRSRILRLYEYARGTCPYAKYVSDHTLSLPMHVRLTDDDVKYIIDTVKKYVSE